MIKFPQAVTQAMRFVERHQSELWLGRLESALERRGIDEGRRDRWKKALAPFLSRHALRPRQSCGSHRPRRSRAPRRGKHRLKAPRACQREGEPQLLPLLR